MTFTTGTLNKALANYGVDLTKINTIDELIKAFSYYTHEVIVENIIRYIALINGELVVCVTDVNNKLVRVYFE